MMSDTHFVPAARAKRWFYSAAIICIALEAVGVFIGKLRPEYSDSNIIFYLTFFGSVLLFILASVYYVIPIGKWFVRRRMIAGRCLNCGYLLRTTDAANGRVARICPECGWDQEMPLPYLFEFRKGMPVVDDEHEQSS